MKIRCLKCNDVIEAVYSRDFKKCKCGACLLIMVMNILD